MFAYGLHIYIFKLGKAFMQLSMCSPSVPCGELCCGSTVICMATRAIGVGILLSH